MEKKRAYGERKERFLALEVQYHLHENPSILAAFRANTPLESEFETVKWRRDMQQLLEVSLAEALIRLKKLEILFFTYL